MVNDTETGDRADDGPPDPKQHVLNMLLQFSQTDNFTPSKEMHGLSGMNAIAHIICMKDYEIYCLRMALAHSRAIIDVRREATNDN